MDKTYLRKLILSQGNRLLITGDGLSAAVAEAFFPVTAGTAFPFRPDPPSYKEQTAAALASLQGHLNVTGCAEGGRLTVEFDSTELPAGSIAYHRLWGFVTAGSDWHFSTRRFEKDLIAAEANPAIDCHFIHANSPGGEAWYLPRLSETMRSLRKPVMTLYEECNCSAAYYITCHSDYLAALTTDDFTGCIGVMTEAYDLSGLYERMGIRPVVAKASRSDLKNKKYEDLLAGKPESFVADVLDPLADAFIAEVRACRPRLADLPDDDPALRGETFYTPQAVEKGLADGCLTMAEAVEQAADMGRVNRTVNF